VEGNSPNKGETQSRNRQGSQSPNEEDKQPHFYSKTEIKVKEVDSSTRQILLDNVLQVLETKSIVKDTHFAKEEKKHMSH
jgi:hypothetical protein